MGGSCCVQKPPPEEEERESEIESTIKNKYKYDKNKIPAKGALKSATAIFFTSPSEIK